ncbi:hypothetical protein JHK87_006755 [Glycine soja]|nr:hypothetical protein JHK87_006755 [Glycine soja]
MEVQEECNSFNKKVFGNILVRKRKVEARLNGVQLALEDGDSKSLRRIEQELYAKTAISTRFSHKPSKLPLSSAFAIQPLSTTTATNVSGAIDGTTIAVVSGGFVIALATVLSLTDPEQRR